MKPTLTIEQMQHLSELGCSTRNASMCLIRDTEGNRHLSVHDEYCYEAAYMNPIPVYTLADIIELLPSAIIKDGDEYWLEFGKSNLPHEKDTYYVKYISLFDIDLVSFGTQQDYELIDVAYQMLCWCIENRHIETKPDKMKEGI